MINNNSNHDTSNLVVDSFGMSADIDQALPLNCNLIPISEQLITLSEEIVRDVSEGQKLSALKFKNNLLVMQTVIANLYQCYEYWRRTGSAIGHIPWLTISKNKNSYRVSSRYQDKVFTHRTLVDKTIYPMIKHGLLYEVKGYFSSSSGRGKQTRLGFSGHTLMSAFADVYDESQMIGELAVKISAGAESIILKGASKQLIDYEDNSFTNASRNQVEALIELTNANRVEHAGIPIITGSLKRVFNDSDWEKGGRFYCHYYQNFSKEERAKLTMNGQSVVERDYSGLHMNMAYAMQTGHTCSTYPYDYTQFGLDLQAFKPLMKVSTLIAFNCDNPSSATRAINEEIQKQPEEIKARVSGKQVLQTIKEKHKPIASLFCSGFGLSLQNEDSKIASQILDTCLKEEVPALSVHDSFIVPEEHDQMIQDTMVGAFKDRFGCSIIVD